MSNFKSSVLIFILCCFSFELTAQTTDWTYVSGSGSNTRILIREVNNKVSEVKMRTDNGSDWTSMTIMKINGKADYIRVKSNVSNRIYELYVHWYEDKLIKVDPDTNKEVFWLVK